MLGWEGQMNLIMTGGVAKGEEGRGKGGGEREKMRPQSWLSHIRI